MKTRNVIKRNDLIQITDGDTMDSYIINADDFSKGVAGNWAVATGMINAVNKTVKILMARIEKLESVKEAPKPKKKEK